MKRRNKTNNERLTEAGKLITSAYVISQIIPGCDHLEDFKDNWSMCDNEETIPEIQQAIADSINKWLSKSDPEEITTTLYWMKVIAKYRPTLIHLTKLINPKYRIYFDSDNKAIPRMFGIVCPFFVMSSTEQKFPTTRETLKFERGNTTLEIDGMLLKAEDAQLIQALMISMRDKIDKISEDGIYFIPSIKKIANILHKNPNAPSTIIAIKDGLKRLRGCVMTLTNTKGQWIIGGILNKASKIDDKEIRIILYKDFMGLFICGYINLDPDIHLRLKPAEANLYRYLMNDKTFNNSGKLPRRHNKTIFIQAGLGYPNQTYKPSYIRSRLINLFSKLTDCGIIKHPVHVVGGYTMIGYHKALSPNKRRVLEAP